MFIKIDEDPIVSSTQIDSIWLFCSVVIGEVQEFAKLYVKNGLTCAEYTDNHEGNFETVITKNLIKKLHEKS
jgi:hypothetical protein